MSAPTSALQAYVPMERLHDLAAGTSAAAWRAEGVALMADLSGFTPLTEALIVALGQRLGAERLVEELDPVFTALVAAVHAHGGSVVSFMGDAILCWFDPARGPCAEPALAAAGAARAIRSVVRDTAPLTPPGVEPIRLGVRCAIGSAEGLRCVVGDPAVQRFEILAGDAAERVAWADAAAQEDEIVCDEATAAALPPTSVARWRDGAGGRFAVLVDAPASPGAGWGPLQGLEPERLGGWAPSVVAAPGAAGYRGQMRLVATVFVRFPGIDYSAADASARLDRYTRWVQGVLAELDGTLLRVMVGDKGSYLYAGFGAVRAHEDDVRRACEAALRLRAPHPEIGGAPQVGVSQGVVYAGPYGARSRCEFGLMGHEVNFAARLMSAAAPGQALLSRRVARRAAGFELVAQPPRRFKGVAGEVPTWELVARASAATRGVSGRSRAHLVGRAAELAAFEAALGRLRDGAQCAVVLEGEAGIGKSHLLEAMLESVPAEVRILRGAGDALAQHADLRALRSVVSGLYDEGGGSLEERVRARVPAELAPWLPLLGAVLPLELPPTPETANLAGEERARRTLEVIADVVGASVGGPWVLVVEDLHWLDPASWRLLRFLLATEAPVLAVLASRSVEVRPPLLDELSGDATTAWFRLGPLGPADAVALAARRLGVDGLPDPVVQHLAARAAGHPLFTEELALALRDAGALHIEGRGATLAPEADLAALDLPDTLVGLIGSRIDRATPAQQQALRVAAVIGRSFEVEAVRVIHPGDRSVEGLVFDLDATRRLDLLEVDPSTGGYRFRHAVTRDVAYDTLLRADRRVLHAAMARHLESRGGEGGGDLLAQAAHWEAADEAAQAVDRYEAASGQLLREGSHPATRHALERILVLEASLEDTSPARRAGWLRDLSQAWFGLGDFEQCRAHGVAAVRSLGGPYPRSVGGAVAGVLVRMPAHLLRLVRSPRLGDGPTEPDARIEAEALLHTTYAAGFAGAIPYLVFGAYRLAELSVRSSLADIGAYAFGLLAYALQASRLPGLARRHADRARWYLERAGESQSSVRGVLILSMYDFVGLRLEPALQGCLRGEEAAGRVGASQRLDELRAVRGSILQLEADFDGCRQLFDEILADPHRADSPHGSSFAVLTLAVLAALRGRFQETLDLARRYEEEEGGRHDVAQAPLLHAMKALASLRLGDVERADAEAAEARRLLESTTTPIFAIYPAYYFLAEHALTRWEQGEGARRDAQAAMKLLWGFARGYPFAEPAAWAWEVRYQLGLGRSKAARRAAQRAVEGARAGGMPFEEGLALLHGAGLAPEGSPERGAALAEARAVFESIGSTWHGQQEK